MPTQRMPNFQVLTLDQLLEMLATDDGMREVEAVARGNADQLSFPLCDDPECEACNQVRAEAAKRAN